MLQMDIQYKQIPDQWSCDSIRHLKTCPIYILAGPLPSGIVIYQATEAQINLWYIRTPPDYLVDHQAVEDLPDLWYIQTPPELPCETPGS